MLVSKRNIFLTKLFEGLHDAGIEYCVSRNASETFENTVSDLDILVSPANGKTTEDLCISIAKQTGYHLALKTHFSNLCLLFWSSSADFVRIDIEGDLRWRIFPVISAENVLKGRRKQDLQWVPSPVAESLVLASTIACANKLSPRYKKRLDVLWDEIETGPAGVISEENRKIITLARGGETRKLRRFLIRRARMSTFGWIAMCRATLEDLVRFSRRMLQPPGYRIRLQGPDWIDMHKVASYLALAFPAGKSYSFSGNGSRLKILLSLFRGGLVVEKSACPTPPLPERSGLLGGRNSRSQNRVSAFRPTKSMQFILHEDSGRMCQVLGSHENPEMSLVSFLAASMARNQAPQEARRRKGAFVVLVGLDGAGKTTFARNLCIALTQDADVKRTRYYHWIPSLWRREYPWPATAETPRKVPEQGQLNRLLSIARLFKNLVQARWIYLVGIRLWVRQGDIVVVDRFIYNYWLDPVSLKYSGPAWLLGFAAHLIPQPDLVFSLETDAHTLRSRKEELTFEEISAQSAALQSLPLGRARKVVIDAGLTQDEIVSTALKELKITDLTGSLSSYPQLEETASFRRDD